MTRQLPRPPTAQSGRTAGHGGDAVLSLTPTEAAADRCPSGLIYRKYYGTKMMLTLLAIFYATMVAAGYIIEFTFGALGLIPTQRNAQVTQTAITWNYTTILNIIFLLLAAALLIRFFRSGGRPMLTMMGGAPGEASAP